MILFASSGNSLSSQNRFTESKMISQGIVFCSNSKSEIMIVNYGKGHIVAFDITEQCLKIPKSAKCYKSLNIQRPVR